nr:hypothetical protein [Angustibacter aerolatus]
MAPAAPQGRPGRREEEGQGQARRHRPGRRRAARRRRVLRRAEAEVGVRGHREEAGAGEGRRRRGRPGERQPGRWALPRLGFALQAAKAVKEEPDPSEATDIAIEPVQRPEHGEGSPSPRAERR